jgi:prepilin-type N-terminal cleavage/methylation domain-containing protein
LIRESIIFIVFNRKGEKDMWSRLKKEEGGFTLIELIIVIVILGIIAGVAIPKFIGLSDSARLSAARGVGGALSSTITSLHAQYLISGDAADEYTIADVVTGTKFSGGITASSDAAAGEITAVIKGKSFTWDYADVDTSDEIAAEITEDSTSEFP